MRLPKRPFAGGVAFAWLLVVTLGLTAASAAGGWSTSKRVFDGSYREISMAIDSNGRVHAAAKGTSGLWYLTNRTGSWRRVRLTTNPLDGADHQPSIAVDKNDRVHVAFARETCADCVPYGSVDVYYLTDRGRQAGTFPEDATWIDTGGAPSLKVVNGKSYLAYSRLRFEPNPDGGYDDAIPTIRFRTNASGSWTNVRAADHAINPSLQVDSNGRARIAFESELGGIGYASARSLRGNFTVDSLTYDQDVRPRLALDSTDRPHIAWTRDRGSSNGGGSYYAKQSSGTWVGGRFTTIKWDVQLVMDQAKKPRLAVLGPVEGIYYYRLVDGSLVRQTLSSTAIATSVGIALGSNGRPIVVYTTNGGVPNGVYYTRKT